MALSASTRGVVDGTERFYCQATELRDATTPLPWWGPGQFVRDVVGNIGLLRLGHGLLVWAFNMYQALSERVLPGRLRLRGGCAVTVHLGTAAQTQPAPPARPAARRARRGEVVRGDPGDARRRGPQSRVDVRRRDDPVLRPALPGPAAGRARGRRGRRDAACPRTASSSTAWSAGICRLFCPRAIYPSGARCGCAGSAEPAGHR